MNEFVITGYVYFIQAGNEKVVKIGSTINNLEERILSLQTANYLELNLLGAIDIKIELDQQGLNRIQYSHLVKQREMEIHKLFEAYRIRGEWFKLEADLIEYIHKYSNI